MDHLGGIYNLTFSASPLRCCHNQSINSNPCDTTVRNSGFEILWSMTELRRSSRVRQSAKHNTPQYYEPDEKTRMFATPDVRPRKWQEVEVPVGYFVIKRWVPRNQDHLTAELHGGLTDKPEMGAAGKFPFRNMNKFATKGRNRSRGALAPAARGKGITRSARSAAAAAAAAASASVSAANWNSPGNLAPPGQAQGQGQAPTSGSGSGSAPASAPTPIPPTVTIPSAYPSPSASSRARGVMQDRIATKRPSSVLGRNPENEPPAHIRRNLDDAIGRGGRSGTIRGPMDSSTCNLRMGVNPGPAHPVHESSRPAGVPGNGGDFGVMWGAGNTAPQQPLPWNPM